MGSSSEYSEMVTPVMMLSCMAKGRGSSQACLNQLSPKSRGFSVAEEEVGDLKHEKDLLCVYWFEDGGSYRALPAGKEWELFLLLSGPQLAVNKEMETSVLQSQGTGFHQQEWAQKWFVPPEPSDENSAWLIP